MVKENTMKDNKLTAKKIVIWSVTVLDVALTLFFLITSIVMIVTMPDKVEMALGHYQSNYIGYLQKNSNMFMLLIVAPMLTLFFTNAVFFLLYVFKVSRKK